MDKKSLTDALKVAREACMDTKTEVTILDDGMFRVHDTVCGLDKAIEVLNPSYRDPVAKDIGKCIECQEDRSSSWISGVWKLRGIVDGKFICQAGNGRYGLFDYARIRVTESHNGVFKLWDWVEITGLVGKTRYSMGNGTIGQIVFVEGKNFGVNIGRTTAWNIAKKDMRLLEDPPKGFTYAPRRDCPGLGESYMVNGRVLKCDTSGCSTKHLILVPVDNNR